MLIAASLLVVPGSVAQADAETARDEDPTGDVSAYGPAGPVPEAVLPTPLASPVDLTAAWIGQETPTRLSFGIEVDDMTRPQTPLLQGVTYVLCFERGATDSRYALVAVINYGSAIDVAPDAEPQLVTLSLKKLAAKAGDPVESGCDPFGKEQVRWTLSEKEVEVGFDPAEGSIQADVPRVLFGGLGRDAEGNGGDPLPSAGETFTLVRAFASHGQGPATVHYDETPGGKTLTLRSDTGNAGLNVAIPDALGFLFPGRETLAVPVYGVEIGGLQAVPFTITNLLGKEVPVDIDVTVVSGDAEKWRFHHLEGITLDGGSDPAPGNETLTLVVSGEPTLAHKERVRLLVQATSSEAPEALGVAVVDVMGVVPPTEKTPRLYFHGTGEPCNTNGFWLNTLRADGAAATVPFIGCSYGNGETNPFAALGTAGEIARTFRPDVPFQREYVFDTTGSKTADIALKAVQRAPRVGEVPFPVKVDLLVQVLADGTVIGEGTLEEAEVPGEGAVFPVKVHYIGDILQRDRRVLDDGTQFAVRIVVTSESRTIVTGGCVQDVCVEEREDQVGPPPARIEMLLDASGIDLPIRESRSASPYLDMPASGALLSLRPAEPVKSAYINPGKHATRSVELRNEGLNPDTARLGAVITAVRQVGGEEVVLPEGGGWKVAFSPKERFPLAVGERATFEVQVTAPEDAEEQDVFRLELTATSGVDDAMVVRLPYTFTVTTQQEIDSKGFTDAPKEVEKDTPAPPLALLVVALLAAAFAMRRKR